MKRKIIWGVVILAVLGGIGAFAMSKRGPKPKLSRADKKALRYNVSLAMTHVVMLR